MSYSKLIQAACILTIFGLAWSAPAQAHNYGGQAFGAFVNVPTLGAGPLYLSDSGQLSPSGGWEGAGLLGAQVPSVLTASVLNAATSGAGDWASSASSLADVVVLPGHPAEVTASFVQAQADVTLAGVQGSTQINDLTFGGVPLPVTGLPNQTVDIPLVGTLIINEQSVTAGGITVNALRLTLATGEQILLASATSLFDPAGGVILAGAKSGGSCARDANPAVTKLIWRSSERPPIVPAWGGGVPACIDFVTGGGWFEKPDSNRPARVNFGFNAGPRSVQNPTDLKGHLNFIEHGPVGPFSPQMHVKGVNVLTYVPWGADPVHCRVFSGDAVVNGQSGFTYNATVCDYDEPGRDDRFMLDVVGPGFAYNADNGRDGRPLTCAPGEPECGTLDGGNIQLHKEKCLDAAFIDRRGPLGTEI